MSEVLQINAVVGEGDEAPIYLNTSGQKILIYGGQISMDPSTAEPVLLYLSTSDENNNGANFFIGYLQPATTVPFSMGARPLATAPGANIMALNASGVSANLHGSLHVEFNDI